jgi:hypothetical protein
MRIALISIVMCMLVLAAGCTYLPFPGQDVIKVANSVKQDGETDIITIKNIETLPHSPIVPGQRTTLSFIIENKDKTKEANSVKIILYDAPLFKNNENNRPCNEKTAICQPDSCSEAKPCMLLPGEQKLITFDLFAPSEIDVAGISTDIMLYFKLQYNFKASTLYRVPVVNLDEIKLRQRAGQSTDIEIPKVYGPGPIQLDLELRSMPYILSEYDGSIKFTVLDKGSGMLKDGKIEKGKISIKFPDGLPLKFPDPKNEPNTIGIFYCPRTDRIFTCTNTNEKPDLKKYAHVEIFKKTSVPYLFTMTSSNIAEPFKTYDITASADYTYELRDSAKVTITPVR